MNSLEPNHTHLIYSVMMFSLLERPLPLKPPIKRKLFRKLTQYAFNLIQQETHKHTICMKMHTNNDTSTRLVYYQLHPRFTSHSSAIVLLTLTRVHLADLLYEGLIKTCNYGATYWNHEVLVQALYEGIDSSYTSTLM